MTTDWVDWHKAYEDPQSGLSWRVNEVRRQLGAALDRAPSGPLRIISACAGQGRDVIPVVADHRRCNDITARLVEFDSQLAAEARATAGPNVEVITGDASTTSAFEGMAPANIALFCGIFGNITDGDIRRTIDLLPSLLTPRGEVLWTRGAFVDNDLRPVVRGWFRDAGYEEEAFADYRTHGVGTHRLAETTTPASFEAGVTMFKFLW